MNERYNPIEDATHTKGNFLYMSERYYEWDDLTWYRWSNTNKAWVELLHKPKGLIEIKKLEI